jgi:sugar phosphate isomerase/epimerase
MAFLFSCREGVYGTWKEAVEHLPGTGIQALEVGARPVEELKEVAAGVKAAGLTIGTLAGGVNFDKPESVEAYHASLAAAEAVGVGLYFTSASGSEQPREHYMERLHELAQRAAGHGVTISLETHPPFCQNADDMLATVKAANHPNVKINLDTANIYYYNEGRDSAADLEQVFDHVASLHLKDTDGGFHSGNFPVLGEGIVDFPRIFRKLKSASFAGPLTLELEGPVVGGKDLAERHAAVVGCMEYLKGIGAA